MGDFDGIQARIDRLQADLRALYRHQQADLEREWARFVSRAKHADKRVVVAGAAVVGLAVAAGAIAWWLREED